MARPEHIFIFCYDIEKDSSRIRLSNFLSEHLVRVQKSVFEGRLSGNQAQKIATKASVHLGPNDSLRIYCVTEAGRRGSLAFGPTPLPEAGDFWLM